MLQEDTDEVNPVNGKGRERDAATLQDGSIIALLLGSHETVYLFVEQRSGALQGTKKRGLPFLLRPHQVKHGSQPVPGCMLTCLLIQS